MLVVRLIAVVWLCGGVYILLASRFSPGWFGTVTAALAIPAGVGILTRRRWAVIPSVLLCLWWGALAILFMVWGNGPTVDNAVLLIAAVACATTVVHWHRSRNSSTVTFELR